MGQRISTDLVELHGKIGSTFVRQIRDVPRPIARSFEKNRLLYLRNGLLSFCGKTTDPDGSSRLAQGVSPGFKAQIAESSEGRRRETLSQLR